ncbi:MAG: hypothetical protein AB7I50_18730 [Vicinamibacterales bacterium]
MRTRTLAVMAAVLMASEALGTAQQRSVAADPVKLSWYKAADALGMLRLAQEVDRVSSMNFWATGTLVTEAQPCTLTSYRASVNWLHTGMRVDFTCQQQPQRRIFVVNGTSAWNETEPGRNATPVPAAADERQLQIWLLPQGIVKAAAAAGSRFAVTTEGTQTVWTLVVPSVGATVTARLNEKSLIERVEARQGTTVTEISYSDYGDWNGADYLSDVLFPKRITHRRGGTTTLDLTITKTNTYNPYVVMPVPANVPRTAAQATGAARP